MLSAGDSRVMVWDVPVARCIGVLDGHAEGVLSLAMSADGLVGVSASEDHSVKLWELHTGRCLWTLEGHGEAVTAVCLSQDARFVVSSSRDGVVKQWFLDWDLADIHSADFDPGALPYLQSFLRAHQPADRLSTAGRPLWSAEHFEQLVYLLGCAGYGWLRPEGVRLVLEKMADQWTSA